MAFPQNAYIYLNQPTEDWYSMLRQILARLRLLQFDRANVVWFDLGSTAGLQARPFRRKFVELQAI
jgi:hypothetical protein